jgi:hypothetical protein
MRINSLAFFNEINLGKGRFAELGRIGLGILSYFGEIFLYAAEFVKLKQARATKISNHSS